MSILRSFFGSQQAAEVKEASALDVVTYLASLASNPRAIDPLLDPFRELTSTLQPGSSLSETDQLMLAELCQKLQKHLIEQDPLRDFDKATIASKISQKFPKPNAAEPIFWTKLKS